MAGINNHGFKEIRNSYKKIKKEYDALMESVYNADGTFRADLGGLWDSMWTADSLYKDTSKLLITIEGMFSMLSDLKNKAEYESIQNDLQNLEYDVISEYKTYKESIINLADGFSDSEQTVISDFMIERALNY
ncbi:hypothetical protein V7024_15960 [Bacillus sp. JJ864]|uniref:hypothetical protein n=1 Tax=Bacillus sp. JJ864 TaxID=3122975 RepID=UPI003000DEE5